MSMDEFKDLLASESVFLVETRNDYADFRHIA